MTKKQRDLENKLISRLINGLDDYSSLEEARFNPEFSTRPEIFTGLQQHYLAYNKLPSAGRFSEMFPEFVYSHTDDNVLEIAADLSSIAQLNAINDLLQGAQGEFSKTATIEDKIQALKSVINTGMMKIEDASGSSKDIDLSDEKFTDRLLQDYARRSSKDESDKIVWPWPKVKETMGSPEPGDLIVIAARPGKKKTTLLVYLATKLYQESNKRILLVSNELNVLTLSYRGVATAASADYGRLRKGDYEPGEVRTLCEALKPTDENSAFILTGDDAGMGVGSTSYVRSKIDKHKPDIVMIDGAYLLTDANRTRDKYQRAGNVVRELKSIAKSLGIVIIVTWQFNRDAENKEKPTSANIGLTDDLSADTSYIIALMQTKDQEHSKELTMCFVKARDCEEFSVNINADFTNMDFSQTENQEEDEGRELSPEEEAIVSIANQQFQEEVSY